MMTPEEFKLAKEIIFDNTLGPFVTSDENLSNDLAKDLAEVGVTVTKVGRKPKSRNKSINFTIDVKRVKGMELKFLSLEDAQAWQKAKNRGLNTLMKAPDEAFTPVEVEDVEEILWWNQAMSLAHRLGSSMTNSKEGILKRRGVLSAKKFGL